MAPTLLPIEYVVIVVYLLLITLVGPIMRSFNTDSDDYFRGGARTKWWLMGPSLAISIVSAAVFTGSAGAFYEGGFAPLALNFGQWTAGVLLVLFMAAWFRQLRRMTPAEVIRDRFGPVTEQFFAYLNMCTGPVFGAFNLLGLSIFAAAVFQIPLPVTVVVLGLVVGFYSVSGGRWAVMATDFLQNLVLQVVIFAVGALAIIEVGGIGELISRARDIGATRMVFEHGEFADNRYSWTWILAVFSMQFVAQLQLGWSSRFFTAKDGLEARKAAALMFGILIVSTFAFVAAPLVARILYADQVMGFEGIINKPEEAAYVVICLNLLPAGMMGLVLVAMFSATASAMDTGLNSNAGVIVRNIVPPLRRRLNLPQLDPKAEMRWGQGVTAVLCLVIIAIALSMALFGRGGIFEMMLGFFAAVSFPMTLPFFLVMFIRNAPRTAAIFSITAGLAGPWLIRLWLSVNGIETDFARRVLIIGCCSLAGFALSYAFRRWEKADSPTLTRAFYLKMHTPVDFEKEIGRNNDYQQLLVMGRLSLALGIILSALLLIPNPLQGRLVIACMSAAIAGIGGLMLWSAHRLRHRQGAAAESPSAHPRSSP
jgi:solute:Na+ symporter, SSS family